ncbi:MAG TPA: SRPBCC family protein [Streptosporangiaceae bacterium]|nr:SRPBCC family protein [Streptosporangiaceae bacterium]
MNNITTDKKADVFRVHAEIPIAASPEKVYDTVTELSNSGAWSPECRGGTWVTGKPRTVGAKFRGDNYRGNSVVAWAPVVRGPWTTEAEVVEAVPGRTFSWAICDSLGNRQDSVWSFDVEPAKNGCVLTHRYRLGRLTEGLAKILEPLDEAERQRFVVEWNAKLAQDVTATLERIKAVIENGDRPRD